MKRKLQLGGLFGTQLLETCLSDGLGWPRVWTKFMFAVDL
jgi:hypothetical protein